MTAWASGQAPLARAMCGRACFDATGAVMIITFCGCSRQIISAGRRAIHRIDCRKMTLGRARSPDEWLTGLVRPRLKDQVNQLLTLRLIFKQISQIL